MTDITVVEDRTLDQIPGSETFVEPPQSATLRLATRLPTEDGATVDLCCGDYLHRERTSEGESDIVVEKILDTDGSGKVFMRNLITGEYTFADKTGIGEIIETAESVTIYRDVDL